MYEIYGNTYFFNDIVGKAWDSTGCYAWCEAHGVDYILDPDIGYSRQYMTELGIDTTSYEIYDLVDQIWLDNNYPEHEIFKSSSRDHCGSHDNKSGDDDKRKISC